MQPGCKYWYKKPNATRLQSVRYNFAPRKQKKKNNEEKNRIYRRHHDGSICRIYIFIP